MHASTDIRLVKCLDGLHFSFEMLEHANDGLYDTCVRVQTDPAALAPALWRCWLLVDVVHRLRQLAEAVPGLSKRNPDLVAFLGATRVAEDCRHYIQHLRSELSRTNENPFPVWGSLSWVDPVDSTCSYTVLAGAQINNTAYSGAVLDTLERRWVSKVCLGVQDLSFNVDPIIDACRRFRAFIIPWVLSTYSPGIQEREGLRISKFCFTLRQLEDAQPDASSGQPASPSAR
ncbi:MAG: hypothetical protein QOH06_480 [Acidobacteriota bacterium]|jgi:hypothetical protein|nr:hypothetical protein [Acidobacteriota bacterium]